MRTARLCLVALLVGAIALATLKVSAQTRARAIVEGLVTKEPGSEPVKKALIELIAENQSIGGDYTAITGADGKFRIEGVVPGRYRLIAERTGFIETEKRQPRSEGRVLTLAAGQELKEIAIRLQATAAVDGRVTDEDGDPLPNAQVAVLRQQFVAAHSRWQQVAGERTNDLGEYRIAGLAAGSYYISVTPPPDFKTLIEAASKAPAAATGGQDCQVQTGDNCSPTQKAVTSYATTYYPAAKDRAQAAPVKLNAGDDFPANFSLTPSPSVTIRGTIGTVPSGATAMVMLHSGELGLILSGEEVRKDGSFEIRDVSPGAYTLLATVSRAENTMMARQNVEVGAENISGIHLTPLTGSEIHGQLRRQGKGVERVDSSQFILALHSADGDDDMSNALSLGNDFSNLARVAADGKFEWKNVPPGRYFVVLAADGDAAPDWFLKSAVAGNREILDAGLGMSGGTVSLDVVASADGAHVDGIVTNNKGEPTSNATVVLIPEERFRAHTDRYRKTVSDQAGRFVLHGIPPGAYTLLAWETMEGEAYYNSDFIKPYLAQGKVLQMAEGEHASVQLEAVPESTEQP